MTDKLITDPDIIALLAANGLVSEDEPATFTGPVSVPVPTLSGHALRWGSNAEIADLTLTGTVDWGAGSPPEGPTSVAVVTSTAGSWPSRPAAALVFWVAGTDTAATTPGAAIGDDIIILAQDADLTTIAAAGNGSVLAATTASFTTADESKLDGIEAGADVTDAANVAAAGALMSNTAAVTVAGTTDTLAAGDAGQVNLYTSSSAVTVTLANLTVGTEVVLVCLGVGGLTVAAGGMSFANSFTPLLTIGQGQALLVKQTAASTWMVLGGTA